jgi:hypothetical protein
MAEGSSMRPPVNNVYDAAETGSLVPAIDDLQSEFKAWQLADARTNKSLWELLGGIYELSPKIEANQNAHLELISLVNEIDGVRKSNRWRADMKPPSELLLVLLLGFTDETKSTRSQWRSALKAADGVKIKTTKRAFVEWISKLGGIEVARRTIAKPRRNAMIKDLAGKVDKFVVGEDRVVQLPFKLSDDPLPERFGLVLVREATSENTAFQVATITNEQMVRKALRDFVKNTEEAERQSLTELKRIQSSRRILVRKLYQKAIAKGRFKGEFEEFLSEWEDENLSTAEELTTRITKAL